MTEQAQAAKFGDMGAEEKGEFLGPLPSAAELQSAVSAHDEDPVDARAGIRRR